MKKRDSLYNVFNKEKDRVGEDFTIFYNKKKNSLQYRAEEGYMTVIFKGETVRDFEENFYYKDRSTDGKGIGEKIASVWESEKVTHREKELAFDDLPDKFKKLADSYVYGRGNLQLTVNVPEKISMER